MPSLSSIQSRIDSALNMLKPSSMKVYKRKITRTGGDPLIGVGATITRTDTLLSPTPYIGSFNKEDSLVLSGSVVLPTNDLQMVCSPNTISLADLQDKDVLIVLKSGSDVREYHITAYTHFDIYEGIAAFSIALRSVSR